MVANLSGAGGAITQVASLPFGGDGKGNNGGIPFSITGTTSNPVFMPDVAGMAGGMAKGGAATMLGGGKAAGGAAGGAAGALGGLFGKKKHQYKEPHPLLRGNFCNQLRSHGTSVRCGLKNELHSAPCHFSAPVASNL
jgi:hypothetical protein